MGLSGLHLLIIKCYVPVCREFISEATAEARKGRLPRRCEPNNQERDIRSRILHRIGSVETE